MIYLKVKQNIHGRKNNIPNTAVDTDCCVFVSPPHIDKTETKVNQTQHIVVFWQRHTKTPGKECRKGKI